MKSSPSNCIYNSTCLYKEKECKEDGSSNVRGGTFCSTLIKIQNNEILIGDMDCMFDQETTKPCKNQSRCQMKLTRKNDSYLHCCCDQSFCNRNFIIQKWSDIETKADHKTKANSLVDQLKSHWIFLLMILIGIIAFLILVLFIYRNCLTRSKKILGIFTLKTKHTNEFIEEKQKILEEPIDDRKISFNEIQLGDLIKEGRFAMVYRGFYQQTPIAIKILSDSSINNEGKKLFLNEKQIYSLPFMNHQNLLKYYGYSMDMNKYYLLIELSFNGSLRDVLRSRMLNDENELIFLCKEISNGLAYLHHDFPSIKASHPPIAHRDLKSDNILYVNNERVVLCDFAMSLKLDQNQNYPNEQQQIGTPRYMSPELLSGIIGYETSALLKCDVYALGIIFWEILSRFQDQTVTEYELPFESQLRQRGFSLNPSINEMFQIISLEQPNNRPLTKKFWKENSKLNKICSTMEECWDQYPEGRISAALVASRMQQFI
ncbi:unnamed protein product [Adineta ricciae]|nr:unnamed protein product [Adineta ricciae]